MYPEHLKIDSLQSLYVKNRLKSIFLILMILICLIKKHNSLIHRIKKHKRSS